MSDIAIRAVNLGKQYRIANNRERYKTLRDQLSDSFKSMLRGYRAKPNSQLAIRNSNKDSIWAVRNASFEVKCGEVVGIIGRNGAGKSTLLKILSRITEPTEGYAEIHGRVGSLLEVGTGFHPELTGRENVYLSGAILGMKQKEIGRKFDEIVAFAEVDQFIDMPMKHYSSGMYMRLAFAVAAHLEPEVLLVDEVLAVGDAEFQRKCLGKMENVAHEGRVVLFVSHNMAAIQRLCTRGCLIEGGKLTLVEGVDKVISFYLRSVQERADSVSLANRTDRSGNGSLRFTGVTLLSRDKQIVNVAQSGEELVIALDYTRTGEGADRAVVCLRFADEYGHGLFQCLSRSSYDGVLRLPSKGQIRCEFPRLPLLRGRYDVSVWCKINEQSADRIEGAFRIEVAGGDFFKTGKHNPDDGGSLLVDHSWEIYECARNSPANLVMGDLHNN